MVDGEGVAGDELGVLVPTGPPVEVVNGELVENGVLVDDPLAVGVQVPPEVSESVIVAVCDGVSEPDRVGVSESAGVSESVAEKEAEGVAVIVAVVVMVAVDVAHSVVVAVNAAKEVRVTLTARNGEGDSVGEGDGAYVGDTRTRRVLVVQPIVRHRNTAKHATDRWSVQQVA